MNQLFMTESRKCFCTVIVVAHKIFNTSFIHRLIQLCSLCFPQSSHRISGAHQVEGQLRGRTDSTYGSSPSVSQFCVYLFYIILWSVKDFIWRKVFTVRVRKLFFLYYTYPFLYYYFVLCTSLFKVLLLILPLCTELFIYME